MSDTIRDLMKLRQSSRPIDMDLIWEILNNKSNMAGQPDPSSPIPSGGLVKELMDYLSGQSLGDQIMEQSGRGLERTLQSDLNKGDPSQLMRPMISSVMQLDR